MESPESRSLGWQREGGRFPGEENDPPDVLTVAEVALLLHMSEKHIYKLAKDGIIPSFKIGRDRRFRRSDLLEWMAKGGSGR